MKRDHFTTFSGLVPESQGQTVAVTVSYVPYSLDSGRAIDNIGRDEGAALQP
jgi:hypothetical protein